MKKHFSLLFVVLFFSYWAFAQDGPYILYDNDGRVEFITFDNDLIKSTKCFADRNSIGSFTVYAQEGGYSFAVNLHRDLTIPAARYEIPEKLLAISDPHGDFVPFVSVLQGNGVIDEQLDWSFGRNHLMVLGDVSDRGDDPTALYWLIYKLEEQARVAGGCLHFLLGNHEVMVSQNDLRYTAKKFQAVAQSAGMEYYKLWGYQTELGRWINSRNQIEVIGDNLFVHAGISPQMAAFDLKIEQINDTIRKYIALDRKAATNSPAASLIMGTNGTLWYRGLIQHKEDMNGSVVDGILDRFEVKRIVVGHTMIENVTAYFNGRVVDVNVNNMRNMTRLKSRGVMITPDGIWVVDDRGEKLLLVQH